MRTTANSILTVSENAPVKLLRAHKHPSALPVPSIIHQMDRLEKWRQRIWDSQNKYFILLGPQHREMVRKMVFSCQMAELRGMGLHLLMGTCLIWMLTGNVPKMQDFVVALFNGQIFLMNHRLFFPENIRPGLPKFELLKSILLYNPNRYRNGLEDDQALNATKFVAYLGSIPGPKPWIDECISAITEVRRQAAAELGRKAVNELWPRLRAASASDDEDLKAADQKQELAKKVTYW